MSDVRPGLGKQSSLPACVTDRGALDDLRDLDDRELLRAGAWRYCQTMSRSAEDDLGLNEAEALLDMDGRRKRLELVVADLQSGKIQPVDHAAARDRIEKRSRDRGLPPGPGG
jgi:hypothetical protein